MTIHITDSESGSKTDKLKDADIYVAIITKHFLDEPGTMVEAEEAKRLGKPMVAVVEENEAKGNPFVEKYQWERIFYFQRDPVRGMPGLQVAAKAIGYRINFGTWPDE